MTLPAPAGEARLTIIADSGSTKTLWLLCRGGESREVRGSGINPYLIGQEKIEEIIEAELMPECGGEAAGEIFFYGAGCTPEKSPAVKMALSRFFPNARIEAESDMLGACRGLCGNERGIVCILGTGSNSCLYDGSEIIASTPSLGYILGDEGSGSALGKALISDCLKGLLPAHMADALKKECGLTRESALENVYKRSFPNRYLASFAPFVLKHIEEPCILSLAIRCFDAFAERNLTAYSPAPIYLTGSIAEAFAGIIKETFARRGLTIAKTEKNPAMGLVGFHIH